MPKKGKGFRRVEMEMRTSKQLGQHRLRHVILLLYPYKFATLLIVLLHTINLAKKYLENKKNLAFKAFSKTPPNFR